MKIAVVYVLIGLAKWCIGNDESWLNVGNCGVGLLCGPRCQRLCLIQHNYYRSLHGSPPLSCDPELARSAQAWSYHQGRMGSSRKSALTRDYKQNIAWKNWAWEGIGKMRVAIPSAVRSWYSELKNDQPNSGGRSRRAKHFQSVVRSDVRRLGCGIRFQPGYGTYVTAHYGLAYGLQRPNVFQDLAPPITIHKRRPLEPMCQQKSFERQQCGNFKSPFITPHQCLQANCCYDDMFMNEPGISWFSDEGKVWCYTKNTAIKDSSKATAAVQPFRQSPLPPPFMRVQDTISKELADKVYGPGDHSWMQTGDCGKGLICGPDCQLMCLKQHNYYRALHNAGPLKCDPELAISAQKWSEQMAIDQKMHHSEWTDKFTESISWKGWGWPGQDVKEGAMPGAARSWYSEIKNGYDYDTGEGNGKVVGHFRAVVWKGEQRLGCGVQFAPTGNNKGTYVTAHYAPASHVTKPSEGAPTNVLPRKPPEPGCDALSAEREECGPENLKSPLVTPEECIKAGCCYDDMFMKEPKIDYYGAGGDIWCFKKKGGAPGVSPTTAPSGQSKPTESTMVPESPPVPPVPPTVAPGESVPTPPIPPPGTTPPTVAPGGSVPPPPSGACEVSLALSCYYFNTAASTWLKNREKCKKEGGDLVSMETEEEWDFVNKQIQELPTDEWHIGLTQTENVWKWVSGKPLTIKKWQRGQPSGDGSYAVMAKNYPQESYGLFNDLADYIPKPYICEKPK